MIKLVLAALAALLLAGCEVAVTPDGGWGYYGGYHYHPYHYHSYGYTYSQPYGYTYSPY